MIIPEHQADASDVPKPDPTNCFPSDDPTLSPLPSPPEDSSVPRNSSVVAATQPPVPHPIFVPLNQVASTPQVLSPLHNRISQFQVPVGYKQFFIPKQTKNRSVIYGHGVRITLLNAKDCDLWYCLATEDCSEIFKITKNTSNASGLLHKVHGITSQRARNLLKRNTETKTRLPHQHQVMPRSDPNRFHEIKFVKLIV